MKKETNVLVGSMCVNVFLIIIKITFGFIGKSKTLISDGIHSLSDLTTDIVAIIGNVMAKKPRDAEHPFGHGKVEYLASIIVGSVIVILGSGLVITGFITRPMSTSKMIVYVSIITIVVKYIYSSYMLRVGKRCKNNILIASGIESRADAITSTFVIISYFTYKLRNFSWIFKYSDNFFTILIGIYVVLVGIKILKENILAIIGKKEEDEDLIDRVKSKILDNGGVVAIKDLTILKYGPYYVANTSLELDENLSLKEVQQITLRLRKQLCNKRTRIAYLQIEI